MSKAIRNLLVVAVGVGLLGMASSVRAQEEHAQKPTPEHQRIAKEVGTWDATIKSWMQGPQSEPTVSQGVETVKLQPGGLWLISEFEGKFGDSTFCGNGQSGYDPIKKKYVGTWVDSMSASLMTMEGDYDEASKTLTMYSKGVEPSGKPYDAKMTSVQQDENSRVFTMSMKSDETKGEYVKVMEISYKKRAK
jgi:hypothetical protein